MPFLFPSLSYHQLRDSESHDFILSTPEFGLFRLHILVRNYLYVSSLFHLTMSSRLTVFQRQISFFLKIEQYCIVNTHTDTYTQIIYAFVAGH